MTPITLTPTEQAIVRYTAQKRLAYDRAAGAEATRYHAAGALAAEVESFGAEVAFCKLVNVYPDFDTEHYQPHDARLADGRTVDVKYTPRRDGRLLAKYKDRLLLPDLYALMIGAFPIYELMGYMTAYDLIQSWRIDRSLNHPAYAAGQNELQWELR
jgi:hypothetical protein